MKKLFFVALLGLVLLFGCTIQDQSPSNQNATLAQQNSNSAIKGIEKPEEIMINGINKVETVNSAKPVILDVNGVNNYVSVADGTTVIELNVNGQNNTVILPKDSKPAIADNGVSNKIGYR